MIVIAICGATRTYGSHAERKTTRFSMRDQRIALTFVCGLELAQDLVAALHRLVEGRLRVLLAREDRFHLLLDDLAALHVVTEPKALRVCRWRLLREHLDRHFRAGVLVVEARLLRH